MNRRGSSPLFFLGGVKKEILLTLFGGFCSLFLGMGIARFIYTPILPLMQKEFLFSDFFSGTLASINLFGYLMGAFSATAVKDNSLKYYLFRVSLIFSVVCISLMVIDKMVSWFIFRFLSGFFSAFILIYGSDLVINYLIKYGYKHLSGFIFSGIGIGMVLSGLTIPILGKYFSSSMIWLLTGILSVFPALIAFYAVPKSSEQKRENTNSGISVGYNMLIILVIVAYMLEGVGYIITGTFISALTFRVEGSGAMSGLVWVVVGIGASVFTPMWGILGRKYGNISVLIFLYFLQFIFVSLPLIEFTYKYLFLSAFGFGGTFLGIVSLSFVVAKEIADVRNSTSILTLFFSIGQIIGPIVGGYLADIKGTFYYSILAGSIFIFMGGAIMLILFFLHRRRYASH